MAAAPATNPLRRCDDVQCPAVLDPVDGRRLVPTGPEAAEMVARRRLPLVKPLPPRDRPAPVVEVQEYGPGTLATRRAQRELAAQIFSVKMVNSGDREGLTQSWALDKPRVKGQSALYLSQGVRHVVRCGDRRRHRRHISLFEPVASRHDGAGACRGPTEDARPPTSRDLGANSERQGVSSTTPTPASMRFITTPLSPVSPGSSCLPMYRRATSLPRSATT